MKYKLEDYSVRLTSLESFSLLELMSVQGSCMRLRTVDGIKYSCVLCCLSLKQDVETLALYSHYHFKLDFFQTRDKEIFRRGLAVGKP